MTRARKSNIYKAKKDFDYRQKYIIKEVPKSAFYHSDRALDVSMRQISTKKSEGSGGCGGCE